MERMFVYDVSIIKRSRLKYCLNIKKTHKNQVRIVLNFPDCGCGFLRLATGNQILYETRCPRMLSATRKEFTNTKNTVTYFKFIELLCII